jgi:16S rRNA (guanine527-N7)-methyltransferase
MPPPESTAIDSAAAALGLALDPEAGARLTAYLALLQRWNATYNLTAVRDPAKVLTQHLADCMAVVPPLQRQIGDANATVLDVGSGAGLPGVVLAVLCPRLAVTCVDTVGKKAAFVRQAAGDLGLPNLHSVHARVEQLDGRFDLITSRAFASLGDFCRLTRARLADAGVWMAMKGKLPHDEIAALPRDVEVFHVEPVLVPGLNAERCVVWMRPAI